MKKMLFVFVVFALFVAGCVSTQNVGKKNGSVSELASFEDCVAAGNPVLETYPPQCKTSDGRNFIQELAAWKDDGITMMRIPETGTLACFGCGKTMCIDPIPSLEPVAETEDRHCTDTFEVTGSGASVDVGMPVPSDQPVPEMIVEN